LLGDLARSGVTRAWPLPLCPVWKPPATLGMLALPAMRDVEVN